MLGSKQTMDGNMKVIHRKPKPASKKQIESARRKLRRRLYKSRSSVVIGTHNIVAAGVNFQPGNYYHAQWLIGGIERYSNTFEIPRVECQDITAYEWLTTYVESVLLAFRLDHVDVIINEVKNEG